MAATDTVYNVPRPRITLQSLVATLVATLWAISWTAGTVFAQPVSYDLDQPALNASLPSALEEISGLAWHDGVLLALQDEDGLVFKIDPETGRVMDRARFSGDGDYEGLEVVGEWLYVLRSDGRLYRTPAASPQRDATERISLDLPRGCDAEGLGWSPNDEALLVACKEQDGVDKVKGRSVWAFKENGSLLREAPWIHIDQEYLESMGDGREIDLFKPSGIAVHPLQDEIYILSAQRQDVLIVNAAGAERTRIRIDDFRQPEGIVIDPQGRLYIASERRASDAARLLRFDPVSR